MYIKYDKTYIEDSSWEFVRRGYAAEDLHSLRFYFDYTEEEKQANRAYAESHTQEEWSSQCDAAARMRSRAMTPVIKSLAREFVCYQYKPNCGVSYDSDKWELFFWCNDFFQTTGGKYSGRDYSYFTLTFNSRMTVEQRKDVCNRVITFLEKHFADDRHLNIVVQYTVTMDGVKIQCDATAVLPSLIGRKCIFDQTEGKIIDSGHGIFFMRKYAKNNSISLSYADILSISWDIA